MTKLRKLITAVAAAALLALSPAAPAFGQQADAGAAARLEKPRVFLEAPGFDPAALRKESGFVEFGDAVEGAHVHVAISERPGEGGRREYVVTFTGLDCFTGDDSVLRYAPASGETPEATAQALAGTLKMGLVRYAAKTRVCRLLSVDFLDKVDPTAVADPWNFWVFSVSGNGFLNGETSLVMHDYFGTFSASRVTPAWKLRASASASYSKQEFRLDDETIESRSESFGASGLAVKSLGEHWSVGGYLSAESSLYSNIDRGLAVAPAVEYNVFPYSESTKRQLRILYRVGLSLMKYREETIYFKTAETLWRESLNVTLELKRSWGTISTSVEGSHYFHDFSKYRVVLSNDLSLRIWKGLSFSIDFRGSRIHDQLSLVKAGASLEEILLRQRQLETGYNYWFSVGLSYTFGSTKSNVVNPRFGEGSGTSVSIHF